MRRGSKPAQPTHSHKAEILKLGAGVKVNFQEITIVKLRKKFTIRIMSSQYWKQKIYILIRYLVTILKLFKMLDSMSVRKLMSPSPNSETKPGDTACR